MTELSLTKEIPARRVTQKFLWIKPNFMKYGVYRKAREGMKMSIKKVCWWCRKKFTDEDSLSLACRADGGRNVLICGGCAGNAASK